MKLVTDADFEEVVLNSDKLVLVDFFTDSCGPCRMLAPVLEQLDNEFDNIDVVKFDASAGQTADKYDISVVPTLILIRDGGEIDRLEGLYPKPMLQKWIENNTEN